MYLVNKAIHRSGRIRRAVFLFLAVLGPGIITMVADNDAGGISTYVQTGAKTGFNLLWAFIILLPMAYYVQEMTVRLGAVTKRGHAEAIFDSFGRFWGCFSIFDLMVVNWLTLVTEYIGMTQAMQLFDIPNWITYAGVTLLLLGIVITGKYWTFEKLTLFFCVFNLVYIPAAVWAMETGNVKAGWLAVGRGFWSPHLIGVVPPLAMVTLIMANIGTTITPWQIFFQQSAVVDKGMDLRDIRMGKLDTFMGSLVTCVVAAFIIVATAAVFYFNPDTTSQAWKHVDPSYASWRDVDSAAHAAQAMPLVMHGTAWGRSSEVLFAIGLFDAGLLGALCISLSTSWAMGEVFGWAHSLNKTVREAPWFYLFYFAVLASAGAVCLISSDAVQNAITIFVQVVAVTLLPSSLFFLILILNDPQVMGEHVNTRWQNIANWSIAIFVVFISSVYGATELFPEVLTPGFWRHANAWLHIP
jgi:NRAMP (natural resistance-associated macrophage protein)-like metal ion transporter